MRSFFFGLWLTNNQPIWLYSLIVRLLNGSVAIGRARVSIFWVRIYFWYKVRKVFNKNTICTLYDKSIRILNFIVRTVNQNFKLLSTYCLVPQSGMILFITVAHCDEMLPCSGITNTMPHNSYGWTDKSKYVL